MTEFPTLAERLAACDSDIREAAASASRNVDEITRIVVTKFHPASLIRELNALGVRDFGENRHQEAAVKAEELREVGGLRWHFVGQLQSKKARQVATYADVIHSVDRSSLVDALVRAAPERTSSLECFIQVNLTDDPARGGVAISEVETLVEDVARAAGIVLLGVMAVAPLDEEPRRAFERLREVSNRVRSLVPDATAISAGMSHDFREAIAEGATHLRIGTAITGKRPE